MTPYEIMLSESQERMLLVVERGREREVERGVREVGPARRAASATSPTAARLQSARARHARRRRAEPRADRRSAGLPPADGSAALADERAAARRWRDLAAPPSAQQAFDAAARRRRPSPASAGSTASTTTRSAPTRIAQPGHGGRRGPRQGHQPRRWPSRSTATAGSAISIRIGARCWRWPRRRATSPAPAASRSARPTTSTSAIPSGRRSCGSSARRSRGIGDACRALDVPITGGNVSLYNETEGRAIFPTPVLGVVGLLEDASKTRDARVPARRAPPSSLLGDNRGELGGSEYLATAARPGARASRRRST